MSQPIKHLYEFGPYRIDLEQQLLTHKGEPVSLPPKAYHTLVLLVERQGQVVGKEELMQLLWPNHFVEESNLSQNIFLLRKALGEGSGKKKYIENVRGRGYRFNATVRELQIEIPSNVPQQEIAAPEIDAEQIATRREEATIALAVLPMVNESRDPAMEYLSDGITDNIIDSLSQLPQVRVTARSLVFRYKGMAMDALKIGRELVVDAVLVSRVLVLGKTLIIRAELVDVATGWQMWGEQYQTQLADILTVQKEVARNISDKLRVRLTEEEDKRLGKHYSQNPEAYQAYMKGRYYSNQRTAEGYQKAIEHFEQAIKLDPGYALAYSALADSYVTFDFYGILPPWETSPKAKTAALKALVLDDTLAEAHTSLGCVKMMYERDWSNAEREFKKAIELDPNYAQAHNWYSHFLMAMGRIEESFAESTIALKLDPLDDSVNQYLGWHYIHARQYDRAITQLEKTLTDNPEFFLARVTLAMAYEQKGEVEKAIEEYQKAYDMDQNSLVRGFLGHAYALSGNREAATTILAELEELNKRIYVPPYCIALIYTALSKPDEAFEWFEKAYAAQNEWLNWLKVTPQVDSLRGDSRFTELLLRLQLAPDV
jgi:DNA-binding winged helix-turn-helix (wHTH) protein/tetratricopeptide (TPR) repeat protein